MNILKVYLKIPVDQQHYLSGTIANVEKTFPIYVGTYKTTTIELYVPTSLLETRTGYYSAVNMAGKFTLANGQTLTTNAYWLTIGSQVTIDGVTYQKFSRIMPQILAEYSGTQLFVFNLISMKQAVGTTPTSVDHIITTQEANILIQRSAYITTDDDLETSTQGEIIARLDQAEEDIDDLQTDVTSLGQRMTTAEGNITSQGTRITNLENTVSKGENYIGTYRAGYTPLDAEGKVTTEMSGYLTAYVKSVKGASYELKVSDTVIYVQEISGQTDKNFKFIYGASGWSGYEIPVVEQSGNGSLGLVKGTYSIGSTNNVLVDIVSGEIKNIYAKNTNGNYISLNTIAENVDIPTGYVKNALRSVSDALGNNIAETYLTQVYGASKDYVKNYALPRQFNDIYYISSNGYSKTVPSGTIQFTATSSSVGDTEIFDIQMNNDADFELSSKNSYNNNIFISANVNCTVKYRITTKYKKQADANWSNLNVELTDDIVMVANSVKKVEFKSAMASLVENVITLTNGDLIRQVFEVVTEESTEITFNVYSNSTYPSIFNLNTQLQTIVYQAGTLGQQPVIKTNASEVVGNVIYFKLGADVILPNNAEAMFELTTAEDTEGIVGYGIKLDNVTFALKCPANFGETTNYVSAEDMMQVAYLYDGTNTTFYFKGFIKNSNTEQYILMDIDNLTNTGKIDKIYLNNVEQTVTNKEVHLTIDKTTVGLGNVDNTSDLNKPISTATQNALNLKASSSDVITLAGRVTVNENSISTINGKIPTQASSSNQLADKNFVNSSISTNTAYFKGTLDVVDDLGLQYQATISAIVTALNSHTFSPAVTNNDYCFVINKDADNNIIYQRFKYNSSVTSWEYEFTLNNSSFTATQWSTINSGLTSEDKTKLDGIETGAEVNTVNSVNNKTGAVTLNADDVGALKNTATGSYALTIYGTPSANNGATNVGSGSAVTGYRGSAYGNNANASAQEANAIGFNAQATAQGATQIGAGTNSTANTLKFKNITVIDGNGKVPSGILPIANNSNVGAVKPDNSTITIDANGVISSSGGVTLRRWS